MLKRILWASLLSAGVMACSSDENASNPAGDTAGSAGSSHSGGNGGSSSTTGAGGSGGAAGSTDATVGPGGGSASSDGGARDASVDVNADVPLDVYEPPLTLQQLQDRYVAYKFGMFLHFNMSTFARQPDVGVEAEHERGNEDEKLFNPTNYNPGQWADAAVAAGMKYMVLTTKHHGGFCLWDSKVTTHDVASSNWKGGKGDALREYVDAARSRGLRVGFYYSIWDKTNYPTWSTTMRDAKATDFIKAQLTELLSNYGPIDVLWFDGWGWQVGYTAVPYKEIHDLIKSIQPNCLILENNHKKALDSTELVGYEQNVDGVPSNNTLPAEMAGNIRSDAVWFYHPMGNCELKSVDTLYGELTKCNAAHANFLLDVTPDDTGNLPACQVTRLTELGVRAKM